MVGDYFFEHPSKNEVRVACAKSGSYRYRYRVWYYLIPWEYETCCPSSYWSNVTWSMVRGAESLRFFNEQRVNNALAFAAYDAARAADPNVALVAAIARAQHNWKTIFPPELWKRQADALKYGECGPFDVWRRTPTGEVMGESAAFQEAYADARGELSPLEWQQMEQAVVMAVPGGDPSAKHDAPTARSVLDADAREPGPWLNAFLSVYAPGWRERPMLSSGHGAAGLAEQMKTESPLVAIAPLVAMDSRFKTYAGVARSLSKQQQRRTSPARSAVVLGAGLLAAGAVFWALY